MGRKRSSIFPGRFDLVAQVCEFVEDGARQAGYGPDETFQVTLACDEACTNIIEHAYGAEDGEIFVSWEIADGAFIITMRDQGKPFDPQAVIAPNVPAHPDDVARMRVGGLGLHIMRRVMDKVRFSFDDTGNMVVMTKQLPQGNAAEDDA